MIALKRGKAGFGKKKLTGETPVPQRAAVHPADRTNFLETLNIEHRTLNAEGSSMRAPSAFSVRCSVFDVSPKSILLLGVRCWYPSPVAAVSGEDARNDRLEAGSTPSPIKIPVARAAAP